LQYKTFVADKSGLTYDPHVDAFYLMDAAIFRIPALIEHVSRLRAKGSGILKRQVIAPDERTMVVVLQSFFEKDFDTYQASFSKALAANGALSAALGSKSKDAYDADKHFLQNEAAALANGDLTLSPQIFNDRALAANKFMHELFDASIQQLDSLLVLALRASGPIYT
jgi:hypothetical protein